MTDKNCDWCIHAAVCEYHYLSHQHFEPIMNDVGELANFCKEFKKGEVKLKEYEMHF